MTLSGVRFRAYPSPSQAALLRQWIGHQRFIYNAKVREAEYWRAFARKSLSLTGQAPLPDQAYSQFIGPETAFLREVPAQILRNGAYRFATGMSRALKGLGRAPTLRARHGRQSVLVTSELFEWVEEANPDTGELREYLVLGTARRPLGRLRFKAHRPYQRPKMLSISVEPDGRWYVSFCFEAANDDAFVQRTPEELAYELSLRPDLEHVTLGIDRGVKVPLALSDGRQLDIAPVCRARIEAKERRARRHQRRLARQKKGSRRRAKTRQRIARLKGYAAEVRKDFAHKASRTLVDSSAQVLAFEDLKLQNMTARAAPRQDERGRYTANGGAAKSALNRALLSSALGLVKSFATYKAAKLNKLVLAVPAAFSSQTCARCGHRAAGNRPSQAVFACVACGHAEHADTNASRVIAQRAVAMLRAGEVRARKPKTARVRLRNTTVGPVRPEPGASPTLVESLSDAVGGHAANDATLSETRNRHLRAQARGGR